MDQNSTNNILRKAYQDLSITESSQLDLQMQSDLALNEEFQQILELKNFLNTAYEEPNTTSVAIILEESARAELETH